MSMVVLATDVGRIVRLNIVGKLAHQFSSVIICLVITFMFRNYFNLRLSSFSLPEPYAFELGKGSEKV